MNRKIVSLIGLVFILCLASSVITYAVTMSFSFSTIIEAGSLVSGYSYIVFVDGSTYYAKNGLTGAIDYSGTNATTVIQSVFDQNSSSVFFKAGPYDLDGNTVTANVPIIICGECKNTIIIGGTIKIEGDGLADWTENNNVVRDLRFQCAGTITPLWLSNVTHGIVERVSFHKTSFALGIPVLRLTDCLTIRVRDNWFDFYNVQILRIDGTYAVKPLHIISHNDFGSTLMGTFPTPSNPWEVAAIYIEGANNVGVNIADNLGFLNPKNIFVYSEAGETIVKNNQIECASYYGYYAIDMQADSNIIDGNYITVGDAGGGAIAIRKTSDLTEAHYYNTIKDNHISGAASSNPIFGVLHRSIISGNIIYAQYGITLNNSGYNQINFNTVYGIGSPDRGFCEVGASDYNVVVGFYSRQSYIYKVGSNTSVNLSWNYTTWVP